MKIERSTNEHLSVIVDFQLAMAKESEDLDLQRETVQRGVSHIMTHPEEGHYLVAKDDSGKVLGALLVLKEWSDWRAQHVLWIHSVYVIKEYRKKGIWKKLYSHLKDEVNASPNLAGLRLYVDQSNFSAISVYEKSGMNQNHYSLFEWMK